MPVTRQSTAQAALQPEVSTSTSPMQETLQEVIAPEGAGASLDERLQRARERRDRLVKEQELRLLEDHIRVLERASQVPNDTLPTVEPVQIVDMTSTSSKRGAEDLQHMPQAKRMMRPKDPESYRGIHVKEHKEFCRSCENAFRLTSENFFSEQQKIIWAMQYLKGDPREAWYSYWERIYDHSKLTWKAFAKFLLDLLADPVNRSLEAATQFAKATQRSGQTIRAFATYLETLEDQLPPYTEEHRVQHLYSKLRPELQVSLTNYHQVPATREELVVLGSTLERNLQKSVVAHAPQMRVKNSSDKRPSKPQDSKAQSQNSYRSQSSKPHPDLSKITCYNCHKQGHYATTCPAKPQETTLPNSIPVKNHYVGKARPSRPARDV